MDNDMMSEEMSKPKIRVLCVGTQSFFDGLNWAFNKNIELASEVELVWSSVNNLQAKPKGYAHVAITSVDLGQPVPVESLRLLGVFTGIVACVHPTPMQLLSVANIGRWSPVDWDGSDYSKIIFNLSSMIDFWKAELKKENAHIALGSWLGSSFYSPSVLEWINAPKSFFGMTKFCFDRKLGTLSVGGLSSDAHVKLGINSKEIFFEFVFRGDQWVYRKITSLDHLRGVENGKPVQVGDQIFINDINLQVSRSEDTHAVERLTRSLRGGDLPERNILKMDSPFFEVVKYFLSSQVNGELRVRGSVKQASLFFNDGVIRYVFCGSISGRKALLRILSWPGVQWKFIPDATPPKNYSAVLGLNLGDFLDVYFGWLSRWKKIASLVPPSNIKVRVRPESFSQIKHWTNHKYEVVARVCEYGRVNEVLNNTPLDDIDILETLIEFRRSGLIEAHQ